MHAENSAAVKARIRSTQEFVLHNIHHKAQAKQSDMVPKSKAKSEKQSEEATLGHGYARRRRHHGG